VHALGQVAAFDSDARLALGEFMRGLNHFLPPDIVVRAAREVEAGFDPRRRARNRAYYYRVDTRPVRSPLLRDRVWHVGREVDVEAMRCAARRLEGAHNFAAFAGPYGGSTNRTLRRCEVSAARGLVKVVMEAEAFLPHQVRRTVGPLVDVGIGRATEGGLVALLVEAQPSSAGPAAPPCGLYLERIEYDELDFGRIEGTGRNE
jgi:tRNA pseudouridine38-40 synthase